MKLWKLALILLLPTLAQAKASVSHAEVFKGWKFEASYEAYGEDLKTLPKVAIACENKTLLPTHPQQDTKKYHLAVYGEYNNFSMRGGPRGTYGNICQTWSNTPQEEKRTCLRSKTIELIVISDLYQDYCGNVYRGFFKRQFFNVDESMGSLVSLGKTFYENPYSQFRGTNLVETYVGGTHAVSSSQFLYFSKASAQDIALIKKNIALAAQNGQFRNSQTGLFNEAQPAKPNGR